MEKLVIVDGESYKDWITEISLSLSSDLLARIQRLVKLAPV